ncbi:hypothetical protein CBER1_04226 [Cercospora berteroae]|uniref:Laccase n=1 Tax=Cercospora berteroae TaxID=357750 RepID=A0A2S6CHY0_9PEZI|nr:hypothetical protein CBER1_04226 [Cercospora berteroae]
MQVLNFIACAASVAGALSVQRSESSTIVQRDSCDGNAAEDRSVWCRYDLNTNWYDEVPDTGVTREYWLEVTNTTLAPDGVERVNYTNQDDGVPSITQCPTAPGDSITYTWRATQYGSSWYHSHYSLQAWEGVFGGMVIHGPATANYDEEIGVMLLADWDHDTVDSLYSYAQTSGPPTLDTGLINGTNVWGDLGSCWEMSLISGSTYLLRLVNAAIDTHWDFSIDNHTLKVIAADFVPIVPYTTDRLSIGMGQRYDILITADQGDVASDFWLRAVPDSFCSENDNSDDIKGIIHYDSSTGTPQTSSQVYDQLGCFGESSKKLVPYLSLDASTSAGTEDDLAVSVSRNSAKLFKWSIGGTSMDVEWSNPSALQILNNDTTWASSSGVIELPEANTWSVIIIETNNAVAHPIHLHGHDFYQLAQGTGTYESAAPTLQTTNPTRRDVTMLPASGYVVIAFYTDNPGAWLCHCHIGWHTEEGFALQFIERYDEVAALYDEDKLNDTCSAWNDYVGVSGILDEGSGV